MPCGENLIINFYISYFIVTVKKLQCIVGAELKFTAYMESVLLSTFLHQQHLKTEQESSHTHALWACHRELVRHRVIRMLNQLGHCLIQHSAL